MLGAVSHLQGENEVFRAHHVSVSKRVARISLSSGTSTAKGAGLDES